MLAGLTLDEIIANALIFFVAGYDTTGTSLGFFMYNMACYPDIQDKLLEEINKVVGNKVNLSFYSLLSEALSFYITMYVAAVPVARSPHSRSNWTNAVITASDCCCSVQYGAHWRSEPIPYSAGSHVT